METLKQEAKIRRIESTCVIKHDPETERKSRSTREWGTTRARLPRVCWPIPRGESIWAPSLSDAMCSKAYAIAASCWRARRTRCTLLFNASRLMEETKKNPDSTNLFQFFYFSLDLFFYLIDDIWSLALVATSFMLLRTTFLNLGINHVTFSLGWKREK